MSLITILFLFFIVSIGSFVNAKLEDDKQPLLSPVLKEETYARLVNENNLLREEIAKLSNQIQVKGVLVNGHDRFVISEHERSIRAAKTLYEYDTFLAKKSFGKKIEYETTVGNVLRSLKANLQILYSRSPSQTQSSIHIPNPSLIPPQIQATRQQQAGFNFQQYPQQQPQLSNQLPRYNPQFNGQYQPITKPCKKINNYGPCI